MLFGRFKTDASFEMENIRAPETNLMYIFVNILSDWLFVLLCSPATFHMSDESGASSGNGDKFTFKLVIYWRFFADSFSVRSEAVSSSSTRCCVCESTRNEEVA